MRKARYAAVFMLIAAITLPGAAGTLGIDPVIQDTPAWCWVAVGEMLFDYHSIPNVNPAGNYQCGIIGLLAAGTAREDCAYRCENCVVPARDYRGVLTMIAQYPERAAVVSGEEVPRLRGSYTRDSLSRARVMREIDNERPIIAGVSFTPFSGAMSQHVALIVGYDDEDDFLLLVNDPYPFGSQDPYTDAGGESNGDGSYWISYDAFRQSLRWRESITVRETGTIRPPRMGDSCCFQGPYGPDACPLNLSGALPLGSPCRCTYPAVWFAGTVCD